MQAGLEDWELSKIRVNLLQRADASDLLERLSMMQPLPSLGQSIDRRKLQGLFSRSSAPKDGMQRWVPYTSTVFTAFIWRSLHSHSVLQVQACSWQGKN